MNLNGTNSKRAKKEFQTNANGIRLATPVGGALTRTADFTIIDEPLFSQNWHDALIASKTLLYPEGKTRRLILNLPPSCSKSRACLLAKRWPSTRTTGEEQ